MKKTLLLALALTSVTLAGCADESATTEVVPVVTDPAVATPMEADPSMMGTDPAMMDTTGAMGTGSMEAAPMEAAPMMADSTTTM